MTNNDILRRIRYIFDLADKELIALFKESGHTVSNIEIHDWLRREEDTGYKNCSDKMLAAFLNGFIIAKRGKKDDGQVFNENTLTNNLILLKLKIALSLRSEDIIEIIGLAGLKISKPELSAIFRKPEHKHYRLCKDQFLRNFLQGLQIRHRPNSGDKIDNTFSWGSPS